MFTFVAADSCLWVSIEKGSRASFIESCLTEAQNYAYVVVGFVVLDAGTLRVLLVNEQPKSAAEDSTLHHNVTDGQNVTDTFKKPARKKKTKKTKVSYYRTFFKLLCTIFARQL